MFKQDQLVKQSNKCDRRACGFTGLGFVRAIFERAATSVAAMVFRFTLGSVSRAREKSKTGN